MRPGVLFLAMLAGACNGCVFPARAKELFSDTYSCPGDRITVKETTAPPYVPSPPSAEVTTDPGRLREWQRRQTEIAHGHRSHSFYLVSGCGHEELIACFDVVRDDTEYPTCAKADPGPSVPP
jgi:hypothetical protein